MRAALCLRYGSPDVLEIREVPTPLAGPNEVRVRIVASTVSSGDWRVRSGEFPRGFGFIATLAVGLRGPRQKILGTELAGVVESVGAEVTRFAVGDAVFAFGGAAMRCHAELRCIPEDGLIVKKPPNLTFEQAAALSFGGTTALSVLKRAAVKAGDRVLVNGASGAVGTATVQLAKHLGAHVTGVCSGKNAELVRSLGADRVIDYTREDFAEGTERYDVVVDTAGTAPYARARHVLSERGRLALVLAPLSENLGAVWVRMTSDHRVLAGPVSVHADDLRELAALAAQGTYRVVIDQRFPFERIADAHRLVDTGHKCGSVSIAMDAQAAALA